MSKTRLRDESMQILIILITVHLLWLDSTGECCGQVV